jgi:hypothetical protein
MEVNNMIKCAVIALGLLVCIGLKLYFVDNPIVSEVDQGIESVVKAESGYDITPIVDAV